LVSHIRGEHRLEEFENRVLWNIIGPAREKVIRGSRNVHNEELHSLYYSIHIFRVIKSRMISQTGHVACMGRRDVRVGFWWKKLKERDSLEDLCINGQIILK